MGEHKPKYLLANSHSYGKSRIEIGTSPINGAFSMAIVCWPEGFVAMSSHSLPKGDGKMERNNAKFYDLEDDVPGFWFGHMMAETTGLCSGSKLRSLCVEQKGFHRTQKISTAHMGDEVSLIQVHPPFFGRMFCLLVLSNEGMIHNPYNNNPIPIHSHPFPTFSTHQFLLTHGYPWEVESCAMYRPGWTTTCMPSMAVCSSAGAPGRQSRTVRICGVYDGWMDGSIDQSGIELGKER